MTTWLVNIDKNHPEHRDIAKQHGFWDMTRRYEIEAGDLETQA